MILAIILACEIGFWVLLISGLIARYPLRRKRIGLVLIAAAPLVDVILLIAVGAHLRAGHTADWTHALAALYIGVSVGYGHRMIAWADERFAHRFDGGPAPRRLSGPAYTRHCWGDVRRSVVAFLVASAVGFGLTTYVGAPERTATVTQGANLLGFVLVLDVLWALSYTIWPRRETRDRPELPGLQARPQD